MKSDPKRMSGSSDFQSKLGLAHTVFSDEAINVSQWVPSIVLASLNFIGAYDKFQKKSANLTFLWVTESQLAYSY